jgi:hypothetical protein
VNDKRIAGLRFDKVAIRLLDRLEAACRKTVPAGTTVLFAITAPIRLASKTAATIEEKISPLLRRRSPGRDVTATINSNRIRIRLVKHHLPRSAKFIGFVHNRDVDPRQLFKMARERTRR